MCVFTHFVIQTVSFYFDVAHKFLLSINSLFWNCQLNFQSIVEPRVQLPSEEIDLFYDKINNHQLAIRHIARNVLFGLYHEIIGLYLLHN